MIQILEPNITQTVILSPQTADVTDIQLTNLQSDESFVITLTPTDTSQRCFTYDINLVTDFASFVIAHGQEAADELVTNHFIAIGGVNYLALKQGTYKYATDDEVGLLKTPELTGFQSYEPQQHNKIYYNG